jgi:hypothetical protein
MKPLMNRQDYGSNNNQAAPGYDSIVIPMGNPNEEVMPGSYDDIQLDEAVEEVVPDSSTLKCPYCSTTNPFNVKSIGVTKSLGCPKCAGQVPTTTVMKQAGSEYISSIELVSEEIDVVNDVKDSLKEVKKIDVD